MFPRLRRILFHAAAALSALVLLAIFILWPLSYSRDDAVRFDGHAGWGCGICTLDGRLELFEGHVNFPPVGFIHVGSPYDNTNNHWSYSDHSTADNSFHHYRLAGCEWDIAPPGSYYYPGGILYIPYTYLTALSLGAGAAHGLRVSYFSGVSAAAGPC